MDLTAVKKEISVLVILLMLFAIDLLHIDDMVLKSFLLGLGASITGYGGYMHYNDAKGVPPSSQ